MKGKLYVFKRYLMALSTNTHTHRNAKWKEIQEDLPLRLLSRGK
jgi:hypothetical protein